MVERILNKTNLDFRFEFRHPLCQLLQQKQTVNLFQYVPFQRTLFLFAILVAIRIIGIPLAFDDPLIEEDGITKTIILHTNRWKEPIFRYLLYSAKVCKFKTVVVCIHENLLNGNITNRVWTFCTILHSLPYTKRSKYNIMAEHHQISTTTTVLVTT